MTTNDDGPERSDDARLRAAMVELRARDEARAPGFEPSWAAARAKVGNRTTRKRPVWIAPVVALGGATALAAAAALALALNSVDWSGAGPVVVGVVEPEPLAFLLERPGGAP